MGTILGVLAFVGSAAPTTFYLCCCGSGDWPAQPDTKRWKGAVSLGAVFITIALLFAPALETGGALLAALGGNVVTWGAYGIAEAQAPGDDKTKRRGTATACALAGLFLLALCYAEDLRFSSTDVFPTAEIGLNVCAAGGTLLGTGAPLACAAPGRKAGGKHDAGAAVAPEN